jgi:carbamoyl-phosphate synthase small subunit
LISAEEVMGMNPQGISLSNGPGDPDAVNEAVEAVRKLLGKLLIFGICLWHQIFSLALGCQIYQLACGHHGGNHPIIDYSANKIEITSHNHGFSVDEKSLPKNVSVTHLNLHDKTIEGIESLIHPAFSVQYQPEAAPRPRDASYIFGRFLEVLNC